MPPRAVEDRVPAMHDPPSTCLHRPRDLGFAGPVDGGERGDGERTEFRRLPGINRPQRESGGRELARRLREAGRIRTVKPRRRGYEHG